MSNHSNIIKSLYELRQKFGIIGLTGRTGSGCSTVADLLCKSDFSGLEAPLPAQNHEGINNDERKYRIIYKFLKTIWKEDRIKFLRIKVSNLIFFIVIKDGFQHFLDSYLDSQIEKKDTTKADIESELQDIKNEFDAIQVKAQKYYHCIVEDLNDINPNEIINFLEKDVPRFLEKLREKLEFISKNKLYRSLQEWGNNIRLYGTSHKLDNEQKTNNPSLLAEIVNKIIKIQRQIYKNIGVYFVIDSLRNPFEVLYFRERYTSFYLFSINTNEKNRIDNLEKINYSKSDIDDLDEREHPDKRKEINDSYCTQDVEACIELSDIHISHFNKPVSLNSDLKMQLCHYIALMLHPGLVPPSPEERIMQIANTAKLNSGCISRQVGAVVTNSSYSVKAIGWNTVAEGQTPCSLRDFYDLLNYNDRAAYSPFELMDEDFRKKVLEKKDELSKGNDELLLSSGLSCPFCFKDLYNSLTGNKNQVYTRSLHAEENAFLQLAKYGSMGINGGKLFTTASCCELCSKKAYQLGIKDIYYIDLYPGISIKHILKSGTKCPEMHLFKGAIGRAYQQLYSPFLPLKDEIRYLIELKDIDSKICPENLEKTKTGDNELPKDESLS